VTLITADYFYIRRHIKRRKQSPTEKFGIGHFPQPFSAFKRKEVEKMGFCDHFMSFLINIFCGNPRHLRHPRSITAI
jgi:hypothetical protein